MFGRFEPLHEKRRDLFCYVRDDGAERFYVEANLSGVTIRRPQRPEGARRILANYEDEQPNLRPYEAGVFRCLK